MPALLIAAALTLAAPLLQEPPKHEETKQAEAVKKTEEARPPKKKRTSIAVPEEPKEATTDKGKEKPKAAPRPAPRPKASPGPEERRLAEAEARAARLAQENARLQQELARKEVRAGGEIRTPLEALAELKAGNARFAEGRRVRTLLSMQDSELRQTLTKGQAPFAIIVTCSDSRLMDNLIFDQELGRLFTIREAGNCPDIQGVASVEYAAEHLGSKLVVVLGHTSCGAVKAVAEAGGKPMPGHLWSFQAAMAGLLETTPEDPNESPAEHLRRLETANALRQAQTVLDRSEIVRHLVGAGRLQVVPAVYDLASGKVSFLELPKAPQGGEKAHH